MAQPPFTLFENVQKLHCINGDKLSVGCVEPQDGVRMGLAYDKAVKSVKSGFTTFPNHFYTLMYGRIAHDAEGSDAQGDLRTSERIFGGVSKFTLFSTTTQGCMQPTYEGGRKMRLYQRQYTSAGVKPVEIVLREIKRAGAIVGRAYSW
jgi:hypothetical protein